jgi:fructose-1-phosphate kinase PfkB-like protein
LHREISDVAQAANTAAELVGQGIAEEVMISLGEDGAVWSDGKRKLILKVPKLEHPVSTLGAGDSTLAGLLVGYAKGFSIEECLALAVSYGTAACMTEGTLPPAPKDIEWILTQVQILEV